MTDRRTFLKAALGAGVLGLPAARAAAAYAAIPAAAQPMKLLILGGTGFTGPFQVAYALARGHEVTVFNRGRTNPGVIPPVHALADPDTEDFRFYGGLKAASEAISLGRTANSWRNTRWRRGRTCRSGCRRSVNMAASAA